MVIQLYTVYELCVFYVIFKDKHNKFYNYKIVYILELRKWSDIYYNSNPKTEFKMFNTKMKELTQTVKITTISGNIYRLWLISTPDLHIIPGSQSVQRR